MEWYIQGRYVRTGISRESFAVAKPLIGIPGRNEHQIHRLIVGCYLIRRARSCLSPASYCLGDMC